MVFFCCEGCNETMKKNKVDQHAARCSSCWAVSCVDCGVVFPENEYAAHFTCMSEAQKYEGSLYRAPKKKNQKLSPQEMWMAVVQESGGGAAPKGIAGFLQQLSTHDNVPRKQTKFMNFTRNSLRLHNDALLQQLWTHLEGKFNAAKAEAEGPATSAAKDETKTSEVVATTTPPTPSAEEKKKIDDSSKDSKKRKAEDEPLSTEQEVDGSSETAPEKKKKKKKSKQEAVAVTVASTEGDSPSSVEGLKKQLLTLMRSMVKDAGGRMKKKELRSAVVKELLSKGLTEKQEIKALFDAQLEKGVKKLEVDGKEVVYVGKAK